LTSASGATTADVPSLDDGVAEVGELALAAPHDDPDLGMAGDHGDEPVDLGLPDLGRDVRLGDPDRAALVEVDGMPFGQHAERRPVLEVERTLEREPGHGPVHRARVQIPEAESLGQPAGDGALPGSGGPVDCHDHRWVTDSSRSKNPGKLTATLSGS